MGRLKGQFQALLGQTVTSLARVALAQNNKLSSLTDTLLFTCSNSKKFELLVKQDTVNDLKQGKGRVVFTSSEGQQKSWIKDVSSSIYTYHFLEALQGAANKPGDTEVRVSNLMNYLGKAVPESARQLCNAEQIPHFDIDAGDFVIAKLRGGKGLPSKGWEEVKPEASQKINKIADVINQHGKFITNINEARDFHIGDVYNK